MYGLGVLHTQAYYVETYIRTYLCHAVLRIRVRGCTYVHTYVFLVLYLYVRTYAYVYIRM